MPIFDYARAVNDLASEISETAEAKGFWDYDDIGNLGIIPTKLILIVSEIAEALEDFRKEYDDSEEDSVTRMTSMQEDKFAEEIADIIIRALDVAGFYDFDIGHIILDKMDKNRDRPYRHGKRI